MKELVLEKEETIDGLTKYMVFFGITCLKIEEEVGPKALRCTDGRSVAETNATEFYNECLSRYKAGYPKKSILASEKINP